ncbi:uncharacterized protein LOC124540913 [Vanessa cardui]|uniref:uncharacterized protein LOC124540913 n=1 Tax=Vanessa cardui TaxID=171605 RepID=UPI001F13A0ED|nr:uncharacterized protein LOC124540913 [Vanessa cardui]
MALRCLQANLNHSARAQDLLVQRVVAIVAPAVAGSPAIEGVVRGRGFVVAVIGSVVTVGVYASPNRSLAEFEQLLVEVGALIGQASPNPVLVAGDFNAKSTAWGSPATDARGEALEEWAVSLGLAVINSPRWSLGRLDSQLAKEAAIVEAWCAGTEPVAQVDREADQLGAALFRICDVAMPRVKPQAPRRRVYWWRPELRQLRRACVAARRQYARSRRRRVRDRDLEATFYTAYRDACDQLKKAIAQAKEDAWREWLATLESDPWGRPYRVVRQKLRPWTPPLSSTLHPHVLERVLSVLFPERGEFVPPSMAPLRPRSDERDLAPPVTEAELCAAVHKLRSKRTAPGPDGIPGRALSIALDALGESVRQLFSACLAQVDSMEPGLNERQYGFRPGRSTLDAIARVRDMAEEEVTQGGVLLAVSLDIANAFNSLPWEVILEALHYHNVPGYLRRTIADYFSGRAVVFPTQDGFGRRVMTCGVPQGSVLGPLLWNIGTHREAAYLATAGVAHVVHRIRALGLEVALHKSEALAFHGPRNAPPPDMAARAGGNTPQVQRWREEARHRLLERWRERLRVPDAGGDLVAAIRPVLREWVECKHGPLSYHLTQLLTGHGCFGKYLCDVVGREPAPTCHHCGNEAVDTAEHTRAVCPAWAEPRAALSTAIGLDLSLPALIRKMVASEEAWAALRVFGEAVMSAKEKAERQREDDPNSLPLRRRKPGRRRRDHLGRIP